MNDESCMTLDTRVNLKTKQFGNKEMFQISLVDLDALAKKFVEDRKKEYGTMNVFIRARRVRKNVNTTLNFYHVRDPHTGFYFGFPISVYKDGNIQWRRLTLRENNSFNLMIPEDVKMFLVIRMHPEVIGSPLCTDPYSARWEIDDPSVTAKRNIEKTDKLVEAFGLAKDMKKYGKHRIILLGRYLGIDEIALENEEVTYGQILQISSQEPEEFLNKYKNPDRAYFEAAMAAATGPVIGKSPVTNSYDFEGNDLGSTIHDVVSRMKTDPVLHSAIIARLIDVDLWPKTGIGGKKIDTDLE